MAIRNTKVGDCVPFMVMVFVQVCYAGMNITSKVALESGMNPLVLVAYRQIFATTAIAPFSYIMEWYVSIRNFMLKNMYFSYLFFSSTCICLIIRYFEFGMFL